MNIEDLCNKLRPIFGDKIDKLYFLYRHADDSERKKRIEQQILLLFRKHVGSVLFTGKRKEKRKEERGTGKGVPLQL